MDSEVTHKRANKYVNKNIFAAITRSHELTAREIYCAIIDLICR